LRSYPSISLLTPSVFRFCRTENDAVLLELRREKR